MLKKGEVLLGILLESRQSFELFKYFVVLIIIEKNTHENKN